jgi:hypothetical protein
MCWVLSVAGIDAYVLQPIDQSDYTLLLEALRPSPRPSDIDVVIGLRGPIAPAEMCNGLMVPVALITHMYSFDADDLLGAIPRPKGAPDKEFGTAARELFDRIMQMTDNAGSTDEHRALNYLAVRYPAIYAKVAEQFGRDFTLASVGARPSGLSATRSIVDVIFSFRSRANDFAELFFVRVDVTEEFPFMVKKLSPYLER